MRRSEGRPQWSVLWLLFVYGTFILLAWAALNLFKGNLLSINAAYQSDNLPSSVQSNRNGDSIPNPLSFQLYLDISPSMWGFSERDGTMPAVAQALRTVSSVRGSGQFSYFRFSDRVETTTEADFLGFMHGSRGDVENRYTAAQFADGSFQSLIDAIDPNLIFSNSYGGGVGFSVDDDMVNIIITDLNFLKSEEDTEGHAALLDRFTRNIITYGADGNIKSIPHKGRCKKLISEIE